MHSKPYLRLLAMTAPMVIIELLVMRRMYERRGWNAAAIVALLVRDSRPSGHRRPRVPESMIPHHAGAILMCEEARLQNAEIRKLCETINLGPAGRDRPDEGAATEGWMTTRRQIPAVHLRIGALFDNPS